MSCISPEESIQKIFQNIPDPELLEGLTDGEKAKWVQYLYATPKRNTHNLSLRNHIIGLYDPFAVRNNFSAGRRWCVNVYVGCAYQCRYCYTISYIRDSSHPRVKNNFQKRLQNDLDELERYNLHAAPIHISNSTEPLQHLEMKYHHTLSLLQQLQKYRHRFTTITILTKNPARLCLLKYIEALQALLNVQVEVSCSFFQKQFKEQFEPGAPSIESRLSAIRQLRKHNISVALRIDPIFPRDPLPSSFFKRQTLKEYGVPHCQTETDIEYLMKFAAEVGCTRIIVSPLKLIIGRFNKSALLPIYRELYAAANNGKPLKKGPAFRLPWELYQYWIEKPKQIAKSVGIELVYCKHNLVNTK